MLFTEIICSAIHQNTEQVLPTKKPSQDHEGKDSTIKRNYDPRPCMQKGDHKHSKLKKMKRQRDMQQMEENGKNPQHQTNEKEISNLPKKNSE